MRDILLKEIMTKPAVTVNVTDRFSAVERRMREKKVRHIPVVDRDQHVVGLLSQRDLYRIAAPRKTAGGMEYDPDYLDGFILANVMTASVSVLSESHVLKDALFLMTDRNLGCIPIVDADQRISGIVTKGDLLRFLSRAFRSAEK